MDYPMTWVEYVARLCLEKWSLDPAATIQIVTHIESLIQPGAVSTDTVTTVLQRAGVAPSVADSVAPGICGVIRA